MLMYSYCLYHCDNCVPCMRAEAAIYFYQCNFTASSKYSSTRCTWITGQQMFKILATLAFSQEKNAAWLEQAVSTCTL